MGEPKQSLIESEAMLIAGVGKQLRALVESAIKDLDITIRHLGVLGHLVHEPSLSYSDLARRARVTSQSMRATIQHLEQLDAVVIDAPGQGQSSSIRVTDIGNEILATARTRVFELDDALLSGFTERDRQVLTDNLFRILRAIQQLSSEGRALP